ncbi:MAG: ferritin-like domain-containing protein [Thermoplasmatota archaeon]
MTQAIQFDLDKFLRNSKRIQVDDLAWGHVRDHPLKNGEVRFLTYMMNIESHTIVYLKELLSTSAIKEPDVTAFLSCWGYEEFFHGFYLERFLKEYVGDRVVVNSTAKRLAYGGRVKAGVKNMLAPLVSKASPDFAATHMTWGAAQEYTTLHAYEALARQSEHPMLKELMARIVKDERRHFAFYFQNADRRLARSAFMQRETRLFMDTLWRPVGTGAMPDAEVDFVSWFLFRDAQGQADLAHVDETMARLPGMSGWNGLSKRVNASIAACEKREGERAAAWANARREPVATSAAPA